MNGKIVKRVAVVLAFVAIAAMGIRQFQQQQLAASLGAKVLRFHVLANSDSKEDQQLKLKVRDAVGCYMQQELRGIEDIEESKNIVRQDLEEIAQTASRIVAQQGYAYDVTASLTKVEFPQKEYGNYSFPPGEYQALQVVIGEGKGENWWCVMYPNMCFQGSMYEVVEEEAEESLKQVLTTEEYEAVMESKDYDIDFGILSFFKN